MNAHILAVASYGAQRVLDPASGKPVRAYKLGYTTAVCAVLLALYGGQAREVSPRGASYRYLQLDGTVLLRHGHLLLSVSPAELEQAEAITRHSHRAGVFVWRDGQWWALRGAFQQPTPAVVLRRRGAAHRDPRAAGAAAALAADDLAPGRSVHAGGGRRHPGPADARAGRRCAAAPVRAARHRLRCPRFANNIKVRKTH
jgi:hypothetical protein